MAEKRIYEIDGDKFSTLDEFFDEISRKLIPGADWGRNFDALDDIFYGGFGTPDDGFCLVWKNSKRSKDTLGYPETIRLLKARTQYCHPDNRDSVRKELAAAEAHQGKTVYDVIIEILQGHKDIELKLH